VSWHLTGPSSRPGPNQDCTSSKQATSGCRRAASEAQVGDERSPRLVATAQDPIGTRSDLPLRSRSAETLPRGRPPWQAGNVRVHCLASTLTTADAILATVSTPSFLISTSSRRLRATPAGGACAPSPFRSSPSAAWVDSLRSGASAPRRRNACERRRTRLLGATLSPSEPLQLLPRTSSSFFADSLIPFTLTRPRLSWNAYLLSIAAGLCEWRRLSFGRGQPSSGQQMCLRRINAKATHG
jgi:hypothetical protein